MHAQTTKPRPIDFQNAPPVATIAEVCATLRRSRSSVLRDVASGRLRSVKIGSSRRIVVASVVSLLEAAAA